MDAVLFLTISPPYGRCGGDTGNKMQIFYDYVYTWGLWHNCRLSLAWNWIYIYSWHSTSQNKLYKALRGKCAKSQKVTSANCWKYLRFSTGPISIPSPDCYLVLAAVLAVVVSGSDCEAGHYHCGAQWRWQTGHCAAPLWTLWPHYGHTALYYGQSMDSSDPFIRATPLPSHCGSLMTAHSHLATSARSCSSARYTTIDETGYHTYLYFWERKI